MIPIHLFFVVEGLSDETPIVIGDESSSTTKSVAGAESNGTPTGKAGGKEIADNRDTSAITGERSGKGLDIGPR